ncbi:MAG: hypothetical protein ACOX8U_11065 [Bradymonadia bacterium]
MESNQGTMSTAAVAQYRHLILKAVGRFTRKIGVWEQGDFSELYAYGEKVVLENLPKLEPDSPILEPFLYKTLNYMLVRGLIEIRERKDAKASGLYQASRREYAAEELHEHVETEAFTDSETVHTSECEILHFPTPNTRLRIDMLPLGERDRAILQAFMLTSSIAATAAATHLSKSYVALRLSKIKQDICITDVEDAILTPKPYLKPILGKTSNDEDDGGDDDDGTGGEDGEE